MDIDEGLYNRAFVENWVNWKEYLQTGFPGEKVTFENFIEKLKDVYKEYTPEFAEKESGAKPAMIVSVAREIGKAGSRFASH